MVSLGRAVSWWETALFISRTGKGSDGVVEWWTDGLRCRAVFAPPALQNSNTPVRLRLEGVSQAVGIAYAPLVQRPDRVPVLQEPHAAVHEREVRAPGLS